MLIEAPRGAPEGVEWVTLARRLQVLRGHRADGRVLWEAPVPWESWHLHRAGGFAVVEAPDGKAIAFDGSGHAREQSRGETGRGVFFASPTGDSVWRVTIQAEHLICSELGGRVRWRHVANENLGPLAAGRRGVAVFLGKSLAWFPSGAD